MRVVVPHCATKRCTEKYCRWKEDGQSVCSSAESSSSDKSVKEHVTRAGMKKALKMGPLNTWQYVQEERSHVIVKFIMPANAFDKEVEPIYTHTFRVTDTIGFIRYLIGTIFRMPCKFVEITHNNVRLNDCRVLSEFELDQFGVLYLKLRSLDRHFHIKPNHVYKDHMIPDIITVMVKDEEQKEKEVTVEIEDRSIDKPFIGGYRDMRTGVDYHHGYTQTGPPSPKVVYWRKHHRDTQTYYCRNRKIQMKKRSATQVSRYDLHIPNVCDKILTAKPYETAEERAKRLDVEGKARMIQRSWRAHLVRISLKKWSAEYHMRVRMERERLKRESEEEDARKTKALISHAFPLSGFDFNMMHALAERWKKSQLERLNHLYCGPAKVAEVALVLDKEIEILRSIDRLKGMVAKQFKELKDMNFFKDACLPLKWNCTYKYIPIVMETIGMQKGLQYKKIYERLVDKNATDKDLISVLLDYKLTSKGHSCPTHTELCGLIDRTCTLLTHGYDRDDISGLIKRIEKMILHHYQDMECFPEFYDHFTRQQNIKKDPTFIYCHRCDTLKRARAFDMNARLHKVNICTPCKCVDKTIESWEDLSPYHFLLRHIQRMERLRNSPSSIAFILQDRDVHHIVKKIWHGHSALSESKDIYNLRLVRWKDDEIWAPWNCILLTVEEARGHCRVVDLDQVYEKEFQDYIKNKHNLAREHFRPMIEVEQYFHKICKVPPGVDQSGFVDYRKYFRKSFNKTGTNLRESIEAWNLGTNRWLRMVVYERVKKYPTLLTYGLSALWHGFYPGYYVTFFSGALFTQAARIARRHIRPYFLLNDMKSFYDVITFITTRFVLAYVAFPFILLELSPALRIYASMYWCFHLSAVILILLVPILFPKTRHDKTSSQNGIAQTLCHVGPITNRVLQHND